MSSKLKENIIKTLAYFDIFDYPLTLSEIKKYCGVKITIADSVLLDEIHSIPIIQESNSYFYFLGRSDLVAKREERNDYSIQKIGKARIVSKILSKIPTIEYIGISGSLAMYNSSYNGKINLFLITTKNTVWITKFLVNNVLFILQEKKSKKSKDQIIVNTYFDSRNLTLPARKINLYTAHEIIKLRTLFNKNNAQDRFLNANRWILKFLPNISIPVTKVSRKKKSKWNFLIKFLNITFFKFYVKLAKSASYKIFNRNLAMLYEVDKEKIVLELFELKLKKYLTLFEEDHWIESEEARYYLDEKKVRILN